MADEETEIVIPEHETAADEEMGEGNDETAPGGLEDIDPQVPVRPTFLNYLRSPIVELTVGSGPDTATLYAHEALLIKAPYFASACAAFSDTATRRILDLSAEDVPATASVLEFLYKCDYFPSLSGNTNMEYDPSMPQTDEEGIALLRHARIYSLATRWGLPALAGIAHRKIHLTQSTAKGEIAYARFVYRETSPDDETISRPVANFWATRSHVLRHEAEQEFRRMCLEFPQFGFDVLSLVLDQQERRSQRAQEVASSGGGPGGRKRQRTIL